MRLPKDIILPDFSKVETLEDTIKALKLTSESLDSYIKLLYGDMIRVSSSADGGGTVQSNTMRSAEGSGSSSVTSWQLRLPVSGRAPNYFGNDGTKVASAAYHCVIGLKGDGTNTVSGKIRFSGQNGNPYDGTVRTNATTDWAYWYDSVTVPITELYLDGADGGAYQSGVMISADGGTNYYYNGFAELRIKLNA
ncbi:hypothetical protein FP828_03590 [bacterium]|nr:hypothetical protein [Candidatus Omnitrophota bacterium]MBA3065556.1 hypothetical protein [bacterium]